MKIFWNQYGYAPATGYVGVIRRCCNMSVCLFVTCSKGQNGAF